MAKKDILKKKSKKAMKQVVEKKLESLLIKLDPGMGEKKVRKKTKLAGKILVKGIKVKKEVGDVKTDLTKIDTAK